MFSNVFHRNFRDRAHKKGEIAIKVINAAIASNLDSSTNGKTKFADNKIIAVIIIGCSKII
jgi:hypothetical protein